MAAWRNRRASEALGIGRPPRPAIAECIAGGSDNDRSAMATLLASGPPIPTSTARSMTTTSRARAKACSSASAGNGRKAISVTRPMAIPSARISSITSLIVPLIEPMATTSVAAPLA